MLMRAPLLLCVSGLAFAASSFPVLTYSTYLRDSFTPQAIATDSSGNIYLAGNAIVDPASSQSTVLVVKLNPQASQYLYVRYLGGSVKDSANAIAIDAAGSAYVAGSTTSPDFPVTSGGNLGTPPGPSSQRSFVVKLDPSGTLLFSALLGGSAASAAQAVAVNAAGRIVVSGIVSDVSGPAFPSTAGAHSIANTANHPYLLELDPTGTKTVFSATGIGGSALALDPSGNIYLAGSTNLLDYPTTPGAYQSTFPAFQICAAPPCSGTFQGASQYVTKVDPTGSTLIYSTAVTGNGNTTNAGVAVDAAGSVYLTGYAGPGYPYTVTPPAIPIGPINSIFFFALPFLSKLDPAGKTLAFSVPVGGTGVQVDSHGAVYASGGAGSGLTGLIGNYGIANNLPALGSVPAQCLPNSLGIRSSAYVSQVDAASGSLLGSQFIGGSTLVTSAVALVGSTVWIAGATTLPDFPFTPNAVTLPSLRPTSLAGAYLGAVDFSQPQPPAGTPQIFCIVDAADLAPVGSAARYQLLTILGTSLGPAAGVSASDNATATLGGASVNIGSLSAPLLYVSATQINLAVPLVDSNQNFATMQLTVGGATAAPRRLPLTFSANPSLFLNNAQTQVSSLGSVALALNADGSINSSANPAKLGSAVSVFVNGLAPDPRITSLPPQLGTTNGWSVTGTAQSNPFVVRVDLRVPSALVNNFACDVSSVCAVGFTLYDVGFVSAGQIVSGGEAFGGVVYVNRAQ
ncbi:MAG TPA: SBBP repeat-containing protein [Candidatus Acidoferrales bacterium]|nr:SBBP repeat-containing protein [Candidatus Acidoferrales bacterium]